MRVVAGEHRGRRLAAPRGSGTRPTADRVREAIFSILGPVEGLRVLDLFAGSGALGIEALSRGAASAVFVDRDRRAVAAVRANLSSLGIEASVVEREVAAYLRAGPGPFDLVFADPPYSCAVPAGRDLSRHLPPVLGPGGLLVTESDIREPLEIGLPVVDERVYGGTRIRFHRGR